MIISKNKRLIFLLIAVFLVTGIAFFALSAKREISVSENEAVFEDVESGLSEFEKRLNSKFPDIANWRRPEVPLRVGLQVGHWKNSELPDELEKLRGSSLGAFAAGVNEWELAFGIAEKTAELLKEKGIEVDILPATVPVGYWADVFIAIHADGNSDRTVRGFKASGPWRDMTGRADDLIDAIYEEYDKTTGFPVDSNITDNMKGYYAFNWFKYDHAIHPMTAAAILETGFITNLADRNLLVNKPSIAAKGIANAVIKFFSM